MRGWRSKDRGFIEIHDEGDGVDASLAPRLFEPEGNRVGLAIARSLVERHRGSIAAHSDAGKRGSTFTITLGASPRCPGTRLPSEIEAKRADTSSPGRSRRVLVVDDNPDITELLADALRLEGHDVVVAQDARSAFELAVVAPFDTILIDVHLPAMDGCQLARELRTRLSTQCPQLVGTAASGYAPADAELFDRVLLQPIDIHLLLAVVAGRRRRRRRSSKQPRLPR